MGQALKVIKFDTDENQDEKKSGAKEKFVNRSASILTLRVAAIITAILGIISLVFEVHVHFQFRYEIYLARLIPTLFSLITLILLQTKFGYKNQAIISHSFLFTLLASISFVSFKLPALFGYSLIGSALFALMLSIFLNWGYKNQISVSIYFALLFTVPLILVGDQIVVNENLLLLIPTSVVILLISIVSSNPKNGSFTPANSGSRKLIGKENTDEEQIIGDEFIANSVIPLFRCNTKGEFDFINQSFREMLNLSEEHELSNLNLFDDIIKNYKVKDHFLKKMENKGKVEGYRFKYEDRNGDEEVFLMDCKSIIENEIVLVEGSVRNITKQYKSERALKNEIESLQKSKRQNKQTIPSVTIPERKSNVISKMGHELRTPMNSVLGFLTLIENGLFQDENELKEFSHSAKLSAESLLGLINDVVEISKIQDKSVEIEYSEFNILEDIENLQTDLKPHIEQKELELNVEIGEGIPDLVLTDRFKYTQILTNLMRNAIQISEEGTISLSLNIEEIADGKLNLITSIEDSSEGFDDDKLHQLISGDLENRDKGTKITSSLLHIMICRELVNLLDGRITATSEIGKGNKFTFELEIGTGVVETDGENTDQNISYTNSNSKAKLLLVEDNPISRKVEQKLLHEAGYDVISLDSASEAIESIQNNDFDLILMDIELKDMDGLEATKRIRELPNEKNKIPIIAVTAHSSMKDREKCLLAGMNDYISKPINITFLKMTIDQWLNEAKSN